jgi:uncharacterized protein (TIGR02284 family)
VTRGEFAEELETVLGAVTDMNVTEGGTASGTMRRMWGELKGSMGGGDHALLATAEQGEDTTKKAYDEALKSNDVPAPIHLLLLQQQTHILAAHDKVRAMRDSIAA